MLLPNIFAMTSVNVGGIYYTVSMDTADLIRGSQTATKQLSIMESRLNDVAAAAKAVVSGMAVMKIIDIADEWGQYASRLKMATQSTAEYNIVQDRMIQSANMTFRSVNETKESFIQMSPVLRQMGYDLGESIDAIDTFSGLLVVNSASAERAKASQNALSGALQKGSLDADGWMTILSTMPSIVDLLVQTTGKSAEEIRQLGASGKQSVRDLTEALVQGYLPTMQKVAEMPTTVRDAMQSLTNGFQEYIGKANEASGITATIASGIALLGNNFEEVATVGLMAATGAMVAYGAASAKAMASSLGGMIAQRQASIDVAKAIVAQTTVMARKTAADVVAAKHQVMAAKSDEQRTAALSALRLAKIADIQATRAQDAANVSLAKSQSLAAGAAKGLLGFLGGPAGLAMTVGISAASWLVFTANTREAKKTLEEMQAPLEQVVGILKKMNADQAAAQMLKWKAAAVEAAREVDKEFSDLYNSIEAEVLAANPEFALSDEFKRLSQEMVAAKGKGESLLPILKEMADGAGVSQKQIDSWVSRNGVVADGTAKIRQANAVVAEAERVTALHTAALNGNTAAKQQNAAATVVIGEAAQKDIDAINKQIALLGKAGSAASMLYDINQAIDNQKGPYADRSGPDLQAMKAAALELQKQEDAQKRLTAGQSKAQQAAEETKRKQEQITEAAKQYIDTLQQQYDQIDRMTNLELLEYQIKAKKVTLDETEYKAAVGLAEKLDDRANKEREIAEALNIKNAQLAAERQLMAEIAGYNSDIAGASMGDQARADMEQRLQLVEQYAQRVQQIEDQRRSALAGKNAKEQQDVNDLYNAVLKIEQDYQGRSLAAYDEYIQRKREADADWSNGAQRAWANYVEESQDAASQAESAMSSWLSSTEDALVKFVQTGKLSFSDLANSIIADLARIAAKQMITGLLGNLFGSFMGGWSAAGVQPSGAVTAPVGGSSVTGTALPPRREHGGPVTANQMYEVNEKGKPELLSYGGKQYLMTGNQSGNVSPMNGVGGGGVGTLKVIIENKGQAMEATSARMESNGLEQVLRVTIQQEIRKEAQNLAGGRGVLDQGLKSRYVMTPRR